MLQFPTWKVALILGVTLIGALLALPNALNERQREAIPGFLPSSQVNLGLDLRGGVYLLLDVDHQRSVLKQLSDIEREAQKQLNATRGADRITYSDLRVHPAAVHVDLGSDEAVQQAIAALQPLVDDTSVVVDGIRVARRAGQAIEVTLTDNMLSAIQSDPTRSFTTELESLETRVRQRLSSNGVAVSNIEISKPALRFRPRDSSKTDAALNIMRELNRASMGGQIGASGLNTRVLNTGEIEVSFTDQKSDEIKRDAVQQTVAKLGPRLDPDGLGEISVQPQGESRIIVEAPGEKDPSRLKALIQQPGVLTLNLVDENPSRLRAAMETGRTQDGYELVSSTDGETLLIVADPIIEGDQVKSASQIFDESNNPAVSFSLNVRGATQFFRATGENVGRRFAIILDGVSRSAPRIQEPIPGGTARITGQFSMEEARDLATIVQAGALPADIVVVEERQVGPSLGQDSIEAGALASIIGLALVAIFMIIAYGSFGGFAVGSLVVNIILILGALSGLGATLTLPGIAGIILTIGMAVDANVLVFERIREEARNGRSPMSAVDIGYQQALSTILDANITTLLAAAVLYTLGSGPVKGFAVTLAIGIFTSVFTAFVVTRWFTVLWLRGTRPKKLPI
ncbi:protein translocase subunit SecD [Ponticaulis profundi]|uniref:Protein translocase subunit SecD n=1 Tax=Ponticaulis profundi TaxID=2665222 RepID=A0ABW1SE02_9PROT